jgi:peptide/nickel transport system permease protein
MAILSLSIGASFWERYSPHTMNLAIAASPPSAAHWLGTDRLGRDIWSRLMHGGRVSLAVGLASASVALTLGVLLGAISGYFGGWVDMLVQVATDMIMAFPSIVLMLTLSVLAGSGLLTTVLIIGGVSWPALSRMVRAEYVSAREQMYVEAARCLGLPNARIMFVHILPNVLAPILASAALAVSSAILTEAGLGFLGAGVPLPTPSWGNMLEAARSLEILTREPWIWIPPALMIVLTILSLSFVSEGMQDALTPR